MNIDIILDKTIKIDLEAALAFCRSVIDTIQESTEDWMIQDRVSEKLDEYIGTLSETGGEYFYITEECIDAFYQEFKNFYFE